MADIAITHRIKGRICQFDQQITRSKAKKLMAQYAAVHGFNSRYDRSYCIAEIESEHAELAADLQRMSKEIHDSDEYVQIEGADVLMTEHIDNLSESV